MNDPNLPEGVKQSDIDRTVGETFDPNIDEAEEERFRANKGEDYFNITTDWDIKVFTEIKDNVDLRLFTAGNYFRTKELAEQARDRIVETLKKFHEEVGE